MRGGYGTYLRELKCSVLKITKTEIIATLEEDTSSPEKLVKGDKIKLKFDKIEDDDINPQKLNLF